MYTYEGWGFVLPVGEFGEQTVLEAVEAVSGNRYSDLSELDSSMLFGTYESYDNIESAYWGGEEVDTSEGVIIFDLGPDSPELVRQNEIGELLEELGYEDWLNDPQVANYIVKCEQ